MALLEAGTTDPDNDMLQIKKALSHLETRCGAPGAYAVGRPVSRFGWTFFQIAVRPSLVDGIEREFAGMIRRYGNGNPGDLFLRFMSDFFESRGCGVRLKLAEYR